MKANGGMSWSSTGRLGKRRAFTEDGRLPQSLEDGTRLMSEH